MRNGTLPRIPAESILADGADTLNTPVVTTHLATVKVGRGSSKPVSCACAFDDKDRLAESKSRIKSLVISDGREEKMSTKKKTRIKGWQVMAASSCVPNALLRDRR